MRKWRNDFKTTENNECFYDLFEDWSLIESSFLQQYNIRLRKDLNDMSYGEFCSLLEGTNGDTPLGNIIRIRSEKDFEVIKNFSNAEKQIRNAWMNRHRPKEVKISDKEYDKAMANFEKYFLSIGNVKKKGSEKK